MLGLILKLRRKFKMKKLKKQGLKIGENVRIMRNPDFGSEPYLITIGDHVTISGNVSFLNHDGGTWVFREQDNYRDVLKKGRITVHNNCFIGRNSVILPNVSIGPDSIIAAGAVVTKDVPPNTVVAGVPARAIMSVKEYADKCMANDIPHDPQNLKNNKRAELLKLFPQPEIEKSRFSDY